MFVVHYERVAEHHEESTCDAEIAEEEAEVEEETVAQGLDDDDTEQGCDGEVGVIAGDNAVRGACHDEYVDEQEQMRDSTRE